MRKKLILFVLICNIVTGAFGQKPFTLKGRITGEQTGWMYLYYSNENNKRVMDSSVIINEKFSFKGTINEPTMAYLALKEVKRDEKNSVGFFLEPTEMSVALSPGKFAEASFTGSATQKDYAVLQAKKQKVQNRWTTVMDTLSAVNKRSNTLYQELKDWILVPYYIEMDEIDKTFFKTHPQSAVTAFMLRFYVSKLSLDSLKAYYKALGTQTQQTLAGQDIKKEIAKLQAGSPGAVATNFSAIDINGDPLSLDDFKGKYVLLDFWASWCVPCRAGNPHLKKLYAQYKNKGIEFIGISDDDRNHDAWKKAVEKDGLPWRHVLRGLDMQKRLNNEPNESDISEKFGIHSLPTKILIDPKGKIIGRYSEEEKSLDEKLEEIFKS